MLYLFSFDKNFVKSQKLISIAEKDDCVSYCMYDDIFTWGKDDT